MSDAPKPDQMLQLEPFLQSVARSPQSLLLLDYDGTLAPFQTRRDRAYPYIGVLDRLQEILDTVRTRVVVISGREATEVVSLLDLHPPIEVWGSHGLERLKTNGSREMQKLDERTRDGLSDASHWLDRQQLRSVAEFKAGGVAVHWRGLQHDIVEDIRSRVLLGWRPIAAHSRLELLEFDGGVEIRPRHVHKGDAVRRLLTEVSEDTPVAYLGDDETDESAFQALAGRGISLLVRPTWRQTSAQLWLKPPDELLNFLELWLKSSLRQTSSCGSNDPKPTAAVN